MASRACPVKDMHLVILKYPGKISREELYKTVNPAELKVVKEFMRGKPLFDDGWRLNEKDLSFFPL